MASKSKASANKDSSMKVILVVALALAFIAGYLVSRARYKPQILELNKMVMEKDGVINDMKANANRVMMENDAMWLVEDGIIIELTEDKTLNNGDTVSPDGIVTKEDGTEYKLQNGESVGIDGEKMMMEEMMEEGF